MLLSVKTSKHGILASLDDDTLHLTEGSYGGRKVHSSGDSRSGIQGAPGRSKIGNLNNKNSLCLRGVVGATP